MEAESCLSTEILCHQNEIGDVEDDGEEQCRRPYRHEPAAVDLSHEIGYGDGNDENPVAGHDVCLVQAEAQDDMDEGIERNPSGNHQKEPGTKAADESGNKQKHHKGFQGVGHPVVVGDDDRAVAQSVVKQVARMKLYGLSENVFHNRFPPRCADISPLHKSLVLYGFPFVCVVWFLLVGEPYLVFVHLHLVVEHFQYLCAVLYRCGVAECGESFLVVFLSFFDLFLFRLFLVRYGEGVVFPSGKGPHQRTGYDNAKQDIFDAEEAFSIDKKSVDIYFYAVAQRGACSEEEEKPCLADVQPSSPLHTFPADVYSHQEHEHRRAEMVGHHKCQQHIGKREEHEREKGRVGALESDDLAAYPEDKDKAIVSEENQRYHHKNLNKVYARDFGDAFVEQIEGIHEES